MNMPIRQLIIDTETTGLNPEEGHRIIEFAALEMLDRRLSGKHLHLYINPEREIDAGATRIHGITNAQLVDKPTFSQVAAQIVDFISGSELIIHNAKFDMGFLNHQFSSLPEAKPCSAYIKGVIDTLVIARQKYPGLKNSLDALCDRFMINRSNRSYHGALIDCHLLADIYLALTREQINLLEEENTAVVNGEYKFTAIDNSKFKLPVVHANANENKLHMEYLNELDKSSRGNSVWAKQLKKS